MTQPLKSPKSPPDVGSCLRDLIVSYGASIPLFRPTHWSEEVPDPYLLLLERAVLQAHAESHIDRYGLAILYDLRGLYEGSAGGCRPDYITARVVSYDQESRRRSYHGPGRDYLLGVTDFMTALQTASPADDEARLNRIGTHLGSVSDEQLRGFTDSAVCELQRSLSRSSGLPFREDHAQVSPTARLAAPLLAVAMNKTQRRRPDASPRTPAASQTNTQGTARSS